ncbi:MAG: hypothetical protein K0R59_161 [Sphingobacterium sp.]|jgi:transcriptional regulator with XRE-family HTH domain|nr:hypothetical protein [Sphingobacterium sp.]
MGKVTNKKLAVSISKRISEILELTGFSVLGLANFAGIGPSALQSYYSKTIPISVETVDKICEPLHILLPDFFDFDTPLLIEIDKLPRYEIFKKKHYTQANNYFKEVPTDFAKKPTSSGKKRERDYIAYIVDHTDYFRTPKTIAHMLVDFAKEYDLILESGRLYELLKKHVTAKVLIRQAQPRINNDNSPSVRKIYWYSKVKK